MKDSFSRQGKKTQRSAGGSIRSEEPIELQFQEAKEAPKPDRKESDELGPFYILDSKKGGRKRHQTVRLHIKSRKKKKKQ